MQIRDLGYFKLNHFARQVETGRYFLSRLKANPKLYRLDGRRLEWGNGQAHSPDDLCDRPVLFGAPPIAGRLLAWRVPPSGAAQRRAQLQGAAFKPTLTDFDPTSGCS